METNEIIDLLKQMKSRRTYHAMSKVLNVPVPTIYRWITTGKMHRLYVEYLSKKLTEIVI